MKTVTIQIEFASKKIKAYDHFFDIQKAVANSRLMLFSRQNIRTQNLHLTDEYHVLLDIDIPDEIYEDILNNIGYHLRSISTYLVSKCGNFDYSKYKVGNRLLNYMVIPNQDSSTDGLSKIECLNAIQTFTWLLKRNDQESLKYLNQMIKLLKLAKDSLPYESI